MKSDSAHLRFKPSYGWGWRRAESVVEVPLPFSVLVEQATDASVVGLVEPPHEFAGFKATLSARSITSEQKHWSVVISKQSSSPVIVTGFAESAQ